MSRPRFLLLLLLATAALAGCEAEAEVSVGERSLDPHDMEETIASGLGERASERAGETIPDPEVDCDGVQDIEVEEGSRFTCTGTAPNGDEFPIEIALTDAEGGYQYAVPDDAGAAADDPAP